jgi:cytochrome P450
MSLPKAPKQFLADRTELRRGFEPNLAETDRHLDPINIRNQVITFMIAGHETTSGALAFALYYLTRNPWALADAQAEVDTLWGGNDRPEPTYTDIPNLRYIPATTPV